MSISTSIIIELFAVVTQAVAATILLMIVIVVGLIQIVPESELLAEVLLLVPLGLCNKFMMIFHLIDRKISRYTCFWQTCVSEERVLESLIGRQALLRVQRQHFVYQVEPVLTQRVCHA